MARASRVKLQFLPNGGCTLDSDAVLIVPFPDQRFLRVLSRSLLLAALLLTLPCIGCLLRNPNPKGDKPPSYLVDSKLFDSIFGDLFLEGLIKKGDNALVVLPSVEASQAAQTVNSSWVNMVVSSNPSDSFNKHSFDAVFVFSTQAFQTIDPLVKVGGLVVCQTNAFDILPKQKNYNVVYIRQYASTIVAMRKLFVQPQDPIGSSRKLLSDRMAALEGLENVFLEPPRKKILKQRKVINHYHYLPNLLNDNLEQYPRRVFLEIATKESEKGVSLSWFKENYPMGGERFDLYSINYKGEGDAATWLRGNVREEDFVVMKAEAEVVEEMMRKKAFVLVDELFLECHWEWQRKSEKKSVRAYWECLNLYGRLRDEGVAVHQWWA